VYGCEIWPLILREEHRLRVAVKMMLRGIYEPKRNKVTGGWWEVHNNELHGLYSSLIGMMEYSSQDGWRGRDILHEWGEDECV
jgi:hypothetical protein